MNKLFKHPFISSLRILNAITMNYLNNSHLERLTITKSYLMITLFTQEKYSRFEFPSKREKGYSFKTKHKVNSDQGLTLEDFKYVAVDNLHYR